MSCTWCSVRHKEEPAVTYYPLSSFYSPLSSSPLLHLLFLLRSIVIFTLDFHLQMHLFQATLFLTFASFLSFSIYLSLFFIYCLLYLSFNLSLSPCQSLSLNFNTLTVFSRHHTQARDKMVPIRQLHTLKRENPGTDIHQYLLKISAGERSTSEKSTALLRNRHKNNLELNSDYVYWLWY